MEPGDRCHAALVEVLEGFRRRLPPKSADDLAGRVFAALHGHLGNTGQVVQRHHVADDEDLRVSGQGEILVHLHATGPIDFAAALLCKLLAER